MPFNPKIHRRQSIRLPRYDYCEPEYYFITICVKDRSPTFGRIEGHRVALNARGKIVRDAILDIPCHYRTIAIDSFVIMPDHVHVIVLIKHRKTERVIVPRNNGSVVGAGLRPAPTRHDVPLSEIVRAIKSFSSRRINELSPVLHSFHWQRNYYECVIRDEQELFNARTYMQNNPSSSAMKSKRQGGAFGIF